MKNNNDTIEVVIKKACYIYDTCQPYTKGLSWMAAYVDNPFGRGSRVIYVDYMSMILNARAYSTSELLEGGVYRYLEHCPSYYLTLWNGKKITVKKVMREGDSFVSLQDSGNFMQLIEAAEAAGSYGEVSRIRKDQPIGSYWPPASMEEFEQYSTERN